MVAILICSLSLVAYVFVGYPVLVGLLARLRPQPVRADDAHLPTVSLIVLAYNEEAVIEERLRNIASLDYPADLLEVVVVADGSDDATAEIAARQPGVRVLYRPPREGKLAAMNHGLAESTGDILLFSDANNHYVTGAVLAIVAPFADESVGMVGGRKTIDDGTGRPLDETEGLYWRYESQLKRWENQIGSVIGAPGEIVATRRTAYRSPEAGVLNEDLVQALEMAAGGWRVAYAHEAISIERASATVEDEMTRRARLTAGRYQAIYRLLPSLVRRPRLAWQVLSHKGLRPLVPWALLVAMVSNTALLRRKPAAVALWIAQLVFYGAAWRGWRAERDGIRPSRWTFAPYYFVRANLASIRGLRDVLTGRQSSVWARVDRG